MAIDLKAIKVSSFFGFLELEIASMLLCGYIFAWGVFSIIGSVVEFDRVGLTGLIGAIIFAAASWILSIAATKGIVGKVASLILCGVIAMGLITLSTVISIFVSIPDLKRVLTSLLLSVLHAYFLVAFHSFFMSTKSPTSVAGT